MVSMFFFLKLLFGWNICVFWKHLFVCFSNLGQFLEINYFLTQYYNEKGVEDLQFHYTTHITRTSRVWQAIWVQIFLVQKNQKWPQVRYLSQKVLFYPFLTQYWYYNGKKWKNLDFSYTTHITRTSRVWKVIWGPDIFCTKKVEKWPQDHYFSQKVFLVGTPTDTRDLTTCIYHLIWVTTGN